MKEQRDLEIMVVSRFPIILVETQEELRSLGGYCYSGVSRIRHSRAG